MIAMVVIVDGGAADKEALDENCIAGIEDR